jgi:hypothetical protein
MAEVKVQDARPAPGEIVIEIDDGQNNAVMFGPSRKRLRGLWSPHNLTLGDTSSAGLLQMPVIPGQRVRLDCRARRGEITDPLSREDMEGLLAKINERHRFSFQGQQVTYVPESVKEKMTAEEVASWLYWMWRAVRAGHARLAPGSAPLPNDEAEIRKIFPGVAIKKDFWHAESKGKPEDEEAVKP